MKRFFFLLFFFLLGNYTLTLSQSFKTDTGHAEFSSNVPLHSFTGTSDHLVGKINLGNSVVDFYLDLNTLDTGVDKRDKDMRKTLDVKQHPFAEFYGKLENSFDASEQDTQNVTVSGEFTIHGVTQNVTIDGSLRRTEQGLQVKASWILNLNDYDIRPPGILFYRVDEEVDVRIEALLKPLNN